MSFATVVPYALIVDGPHALRWWATAGGGVAGGARAVASAVREGVGAGADVGSDDDDMTTSLAWLALYLGFSGVLLFLHSAVRLACVGGLVEVIFDGVGVAGTVVGGLPPPLRVVRTRHVFSFLCCTSA